MEESTESLEKLLQSSRFWIQRVLVPIMVCIGVSGNIVAVMVLTRRRMRCSTNIYLTALAIADIVYLLFVFTLSVSHYDNIHDGKYELYWRFYGLAHWICDAASSTSVWLTVAFTLERYIAVCHPIKGKVICTENRAKSIIIIITMFCILTTVSTTFEYQLSLNETCTNRTCTKAELYELHHQEQQQQQMGNLYQINNRNNTTNNSNNNNNNNIHYIPNHNNIIVTNFDNIELNNNQLKTKIINDIYRNLQTKLKRLLSTNNCSSHTHIIYIPIVYTPLSSSLPSTNNQTINFISNKNNSVGVVIDNDLKNNNSERDILTNNDEYEFNNNNKNSNNNNNNNNNITLLENWMENELCCTRKFIVGTESTDLANNPTYQKIIQWYSALCFVLIPIIFIATFNSFLIRAVYRSQKKRQIMTSSHEAVSLSNENRITIMLIGVVILFLICQTPTASLLIFNNFHIAKDRRTEIIKYILGNFFNFLVTINASCNFLLYCVLSKKFRATFKSFFIDRKHRQDTLLLTTTATNTGRHTQHHRTNTMNKNGFKRNISEYRTPRNLETQSLAAMPRSRSLMARPPGKAKSTDLNF